MHVSELRARQIADILDGYEEQVATANAGKSDTFEAVREELRSAGLKPADVTVEMSMLKKAITRRRIVRTNPEKAAKLDTIEDGADQYFVAISNTTRADVRRARAESEIPELGAGVEAVSKDQPQDEAGGTLEPNLGGACLAADRPVADEPIVAEEADKAAGDGSSLPDYSGLEVPERFRRVQPMGNA